MIISFAKATNPNFVKVAKDTKRGQLLTIPYSHYVEFARWSLDYCDITYDEHKYAPVQHVLPVLSLRLNDIKNPAFSKSSYVQSVDYRKKANTLSYEELNSEKSKEKENQSRATAVPVLVLNDGVILSDSWSIAQYAAEKSGRLLPIDPEIKDLYDKDVGVLVRQYAYHYLLKKGKVNRDVWNKLVYHNCGFFFKILWNCGVAGVVDNIMEKIFRPNDVEAFQECRESLLLVFDRLDERVKNKTTEFLGGSTIGVEDIAIAALCAPVINPKYYCNGEYIKQFDLLYEKDSDYQKDVDLFRQRPFGQYVLKIYKEYRQLNY